MFRHLTLKKSLKRFIAEYLPDFRTICHKRNPLITTVVNGSIFLKIFNLRETLAEDIIFARVLITIMKTFLYGKFFCI